MANRRALPKALARGAAGVLIGTLTGAIAWPATAAMAADSPSPLDATTMDPGASDPGASDPGASDPGLSDPGLSDPGDVDPATVDPATVDPAMVDTDAPDGDGDLGGLVDPALAVPVNEAAWAALPAIEGMTPTSISGMAPVTPEAPVALSARERLRLRVQAIRESLVSLAKAQVGDRYSAGSSGPDRFDCSGLTLYVYDKAAGAELPHYSKAQYRMARKLPLSQAKPGDLVFYLRGGAHHVGLYIGRGLMVHAVGVGKGVRIGSIKGPWYSRAFTGIGRVLPDV